MDRDSRQHSVSQPVAVEPLHRSPSYPASVTVRAFAASLLCQMFSTDSTNSTCLQKQLHRRRSINPDFTKHFIMKVIDVFHLPFFFFLLKVVKAQFYDHLRINVGTHGGHAPLWLHQGEETFVKAGETSDSVVIKSRSRLQTVFLHVEVLYIVHCSTV